MNQQANTPAESIYDDLNFRGEPTRVEPPPPVEIRAFPARFSLLQLFLAMTACSLFFTLVYLFGGTSNAVVIAVLLTLIGLQIYLPIAEYRNYR